jgi:protein phosphatase
VAQEHLGKLVRCHKCGQTFTAQPVAQADLPSTEPIPKTAGSLRLGIAGVTSTGRKRSRNEDSFLVQHLTWFDASQNYQLGLIVVADGVGGHASGDVAAGLAIRTLGGALAPILSKALTGRAKKVTRRKLAAAIDTTLKKANKVVHTQAANSTRFKGMAATAAVVIIWHGRVVIGHVGDCRVYHFHAGQLKQVTRDQTIVSRMVELGQLSAREAFTHPARNEVSQAIGTRTVLEPAAYKLKLVPGDWLLVACDGLHSQVNDEAIQATLRKAPPSAYLVASRLVGLADQSGGTDNCTVVAVRCY